MPTVHSHLPGCASSARGELQLSNPIAFSWNHFVEWIECLGPLPLFPKMVNMVNMMGGSHVFFAPSAQSKDRAHPN